ncbi:universal stress protein [Natronolimnohabitans innermongolicus]|uniref:Stress response protein n=1 Tax=Natronolimnohabitans innermongolicus JCM 12255 TaxID=1227499 RepID=L9X723_9EURY|nr:universal stress protein [Natronolimnohabitans innermongolicus]ELY57402.1 stress response protein [Natronolimnohabitans innermongolicus JCM 12255]
MTTDFVAHTVVPIANEDDANATCDALEAAVDDSVELLTVVHVIEKTEGYMDKAPLEARQQQAERIFSIVEDRFADGPPIRRELRYGTDVVDEILAAAAEVDATAIGFATAPSGRLRRLLSGDDSYRLITESEQPVVVFSRLGTDDDSSDR